MAAVLASLSVGSGVALAGSGGGGVGGVGVPQLPRLTSVTCAKQCAGVRKAVAGSQIVIAGKHLGSIAKVGFASSGTSGSVGTTHLSVPPLEVSGRSVQVKVPQGAGTGKPTVRDSYGNAAVAPQSLKIVKELPSAIGFKLMAATAKPRKAYYDGVRPPEVSFMFAGAEATDVRINIVAAGTGAIVDSFVEPAAEPNTENTATWDGQELDGTPAPGGSYQFSIGPSTGGTVETTSDASFEYHGFKFPVRGPHTYGDGVGAPRAGHVHEGQDVPAACGTTLQAARGGRVQWNAYQSAAGNYIVIDGKGTGHDYVYMHLAAPSPLRKGQRVRTGQKIGVVGETGDATGCHLHMEEWSAPGWYQGGHYLASITKHLKHWDAWS